MNLFQHLLLSLMLGFLVYLAVQNQQLHAELSAVHSLQQDASAMTAKALMPLTEKLDTINSVTSQLSKEAEAANNKKLTHLQKRLSLYKALGALNQADRLRLEGKAVEAADKLSSTKKTIWEAGEIFAEKKARLQGLMEPIDKLIGAWKGGDTHTAVDAVRNEIEQVLGELGNE